MQTTDIEHTRGDSYSQSFIFREKESLDPIDLTGDTIIFSIKENKTDTTFVLQENLVLDDPTNGSCSLTLTKEQTEILKAKNYYYDIERTTLAGVRETILIGIFKIIYDITTHNV